MAKQILTPAPSTRLPWWNSSSLPRIAGMTGREAIEWSREYLPAFFPDRSCKFHEELFDDLLSKRRLIARVAPRGHAKSTITSIAYPLLACCERLHRHILLVSKEAGLARAFSLDIRVQLETNEALQKRYGDLFPEENTQRKAKWTESQFMLRNGVVVTARGTGGSVRGIVKGGSRPDLIIGDDLEKDQHVATRYMRDKLDRWFRRALMPTLAPDGRAFVVGSIIHPDSIMARLRDAEQFPGWHYRIYKAWNVVERGEADHSWALWPARWPREALNRERERIGALAFQQEFQGEPADDATLVFRREWFRTYRPAEIDEPLDTVLAVDPATGKATGDFMGVCVLSRVRRTGLYYIRELSLHRLKFVEQIALILKTFRRWRCNRLGVETVAYQVALKEALEHESRRLGLSLSVFELKSNQTTKSMRIGAIAPILERGDVAWPVNMPAAVLDQFYLYPQSPYDDAPDALEMALSMFRKSGTLRPADLAPLSSAGRVSPRCAVGW